MSSWFRFCACFDDNSETFLSRSVDSMVFIEVFYQKNANFWLIKTSPDETFVALTFCLLIRWRCRSCQSSLSSLCLRPWIKFMKSSFFVGERRASERVKRGINMWQWRSVRRVWEDWDWSRYLGSISSHDEQIEHVICLLTFCLHGFFSPQQRSIHSLASRR